MSLLDNVFSNEFSQDGTAVPQRKRVDIVGATVEDVPAEDLTRITFTGGGGGPALSDAPARSVAADSDAGTSPEASRADHAHAHGSLAGGSLHAVAEGGATPKAGFMSGADKTAVDGIPAMLLDIADNTAAIAGLPSTYAPIVHTHDHGTLQGLTTGDPHTQYVLRTDGDVIGNADKWVVRDGSGNVQALGLTRGGNGMLSVIGPADARMIAGSNPANGAAKLSLTGRAGIDLLVNDSVNGMARTPLEIIREADGVGSADVIFVKGVFGVQTPGVTGASLSWEGTDGLRVQTANVNADGKRYLQHTDDGTRLINTALSTDPKTWTVAKGATLTIDCSMSNVHVVTITKATGDVTIALTNTRAGAEYIIMIGTDGTDFAASVLLDSASFDETYGPFSTLPGASVSPVNKVHVRCMATVDAGKAYVLSAAGFV